MLQEQPFFTNDSAGLFRVLVAFVFGMSPVFGLVVWFLRKGPDERITKVEVDVTSLGRKVDAMGHEMAQDRERMIQLQREIGTHHREQLDMLRTTAAAIQQQIYGIGIEIARLQEQNKIGEIIAQSFERYGDKIAGALRAERDHPRGEEP